MACKITAIIFDKTGTLTQGTPEVTDVISFGAINEKTLLSIAVALEKKSEHPLAEAIIKYGETKKLDTIDIQHFQALPGR